VRNINDEEEPLNSEIMLVVDNESINREECDSIYFAEK